MLCFVDHPVDAYHIVTNVNKRMAVQVSLAFVDVELFVYVCHLRWDEQQNCMR